MPDFVSIILPYPVMRLFLCQIELSAKHGLSSMSYEEAFEKRSIAWGDFLKPDLERGERQYEEVADGAKLLRLLEDYLDEYNMSHTNTMNLGGCLLVPL
jgi:dynein heavy chain